MSPCGGRPRLLKSYDGHARIDKRFTFDEWVPDRWSDRPVADADESQSFRRPSIHEGTTFNDGPFR